MAHGGAGSRGGISKSTFYRAWRENQLRQYPAYRHHTLCHGIKRADLEQVLQKEADEREAQRKAIAIAHPDPTLEDLIGRGLSPLRAWREIRKLTVDDVAAVTKIPRRVLTQIENRTRRGTPDQIELLARVLSITPNHIAEPDR